MTVQRDTTHDRILMRSKQLSRGGLLMVDQKRRWTAPEIRKYGTFEAATQSCTNKDFGTGDSMTFQGMTTVCTS